MFWCKKRKKKIRISKTHVRTAVETASYNAARDEIIRQIRGQLEGTWLEKADLNFLSGQELLIIEPYIDKEWTKIPDSQDLTFEWIK